MNIKPQHPRLLVTDSTWPDLRARRVQSPTLDRLLRVIENDARAILERPPQTRVMEGRRLLHTSREVLRRLLLLSFTYRLSGGAEFLHRAEKEMAAAASFTDWNPDHFLDVAEMTLALAISYDWLDDALAPEVRATVRHAIVEKGLKPGLEPAEKHNWWYHSDNNWNQVCLAGLTLGALAIAEDEPALAEKFVECVRTYNPKGMKPYEPDGVYPEGPSYWAYGTTFEVILLAGLESALGSDLGLSQCPGFLATADYPGQVTGPTGLLFNYSDGEQAATMKPALYWFARKLGRGDILHFQHDCLARFLAAKESNPDGVNGERILPLLPIWAEDLEHRSAPPPALAWFRKGINPLAIFRTSWTDGNALFVALKGGVPRASHGQMDNGSFVLESDGVRWGLDLDKQDYHSLESRNIQLWHSNQEGGRWRVFRLNNFSHNTLAINGQLHRADGRAEIVRFQGDGPAPHAVVDLSATFAGQAGKVLRGFQLLPRRQLLIQDELSGLKPGDTVRWAFVTGAGITVKGNQATLRQSGQALHITLAAPEGNFEIASAQPTDDFNAPNPGVSILIANLRAPEAGHLLIQTLFAPGEAPASVPGLATASCESWSAPV
jgi:hypothetical protein